MISDMKRTSASAAFLAVLTVLVLSPRPAAAEPEGKSYRVVEWEMKLRVLEGAKDGSPAAPAVVTSSFLKYAFSASFPAAAELEKERTEIKRIFNLKDVRLLTEADLNWKAGKPGPVGYVFRIDGRQYRIEVGSEEAMSAAQYAAGQKFDLEVVEEPAKGEPGATAGKPVSLLDTGFTIPPSKDVVVFGFEDTKGTPYFISLRQTRMFADEVPGPAGEGAPEKSVTPPKQIKSAEPVYPEIARQALVEGTVVLEARIDTAGRVAAVKVIKGIPLLDQAAVDAVRQWEYEPMIVDGRPRPAIFTVSVRFTLDSVKGGIVGGVEGGVAGGVEGGVSGAVVGGVKGGVEGGVKGGVEKGGTVRTAQEQPVRELKETGAQSEALRKEKEEFEKGAVKTGEGGPKPPKLTHSVDPVYPPVARKARVEGTVVLEARTDEKGNVEAVRILRSIPLLDQAAVDAVRQWKYEPYLKDGKPVKVVMTITVRFTLREGEGDKDLEKFAEGAVRIEGDMTPPRLIHSVDPVYPEEARQAGIQGVVILAVKTDAAGKVADAMILRSIPALNQAAMDAVRHWGYEPKLINGKATPVVFTVTVRFQLK